MIRYDHDRNLHSGRAPEYIVPEVRRHTPVTSVLDVGCGTGIWLRTFASSGCADYLGIDGVPLEHRVYEADPFRFRCLDLRDRWQLGRTFDLVLCLEVAEHLPERSAVPLIASLCAHGSTVLFSAAVPHQRGQGHVNGQWPAYWQHLFNAHGFSCHDLIRPSIWDGDFDEYWYKQNIILARRDPSGAGREPRIPALIHPQLVQDLVDQHEAYRMEMEGVARPWPTIVRAVRMVANAVRRAIVGPIRHAGR